MTVKPSASIAADRLPWVVWQHREHPYRSGRSEDLAQGQESRGAGREAGSEIRALA
jgi:hypothetical protein